jgi:hypothetical protein
MVDVLLVSLPSYWGREYVYVENYWMIAIAQLLSSYGYTVSTIDASLKQYKLIDVQKSVFQIKPKILVYLVSKKNLNIVIHARSKITANYNILIWDDSFNASEMCNYILEDDKTINTKLDRLFDSICTILPTPYCSQLYSKNVFLVGRDCLKQVLLEGGECEVLMQMPKSKYFPSDYYFYAEHLLFEKNGEYIRQEIITLCSEFCLRKINIIAQDQELYINEIDKIQNLLQINGLSHVRLGIYIQSTFITNRMYNFLVEKKDVLYKITFLGNNLTSTQITRFQKLKEFDIKIKVILELFHEQATTQSIQFLIEAMRSGDVQVAPTALIAGKTLDLHLVQIQSILRTLFFKIFLPYYKKIIAYENNKKYEMRIGNSQQYSIIPKIEKEVNMLSQSLNELIFSILEELLSYMTLNEYETGDIIIAILKKYEDRITEVGGYIDANLFNSCRIQ